jgi:hypothetical protein
MIGNEKKVHGWHKNIQTLPKYIQKSEKKPTGRPLK